MGSKAPIEAPVMIDTGPLPDTFFSGIGRIEKLTGGCFRFMLYAEHVRDDGRRERLPVASVVCPLSIIPNALRQVALAIAEPALFFDDEAITMVM